MIILDGLILPVDHHKEDEEDEESPQRHRAHRESFTAEVQTNRAEVFHSRVPLRLCVEAAPRPLRLGGAHFALFVPLW
jgi:hypothetical protein